MRAWLDDAWAYHQKDANHDAKGWVPQIDSDDIDHRLCECHNELNGVCPDCEVFAFDHRYD